MRRTTIALAVAMTAAFLAGLGVMAWLGANDAEHGTEARAAETPTEREVLYWYDPMLPQHHFEAPGKSPFMDMMLVPKYADEVSDAGTVVINPRVTQTLGVRMAPAVLDRLDRSVRASGVVAFDERKIALVQARVDGIVERLHVRATLDTVKAGEPLLTLIAPVWTAAQEEYLSLRRAGTVEMEGLLGAARQRLLLLGMSEAQIRSIERSGKSSTRIVIPAPRDGVVADLAVREGARVMAGAPLMTINGLSSVWVNASLPESRSDLVPIGSEVSARSVALPGLRFRGSVETVLPTVDAATRTVAARILLENPERRLRPGMFVTVDAIGVGSGIPCVVVPSEAVISTGERHVVIVADGQGRFRAQEVRVGIEAGGRSEILEGIKADEQVVLSGQFLIDSEASLNGSIARLGATEPESGAAQPAAERHAADGTLTSMDTDLWLIETGPVPSLEMGAMRMRFVPPKHPPALEVGQAVHFTFFSNADGAFEIDQISDVNSAEQAQ